LSILRPEDPVDLSTGRDARHDDPPLPPENMSGHTKKLRFILDHLRRHIRHHGAPVNLLDFGCGNGAAVSRFLMIDGVRYHGVDIHEPSLAHARRHFGGDHTVFLDEVPADQAFDVLVYADIIEHLDEPVAVLKQHAAALEPDGVLIGSVPNGFGPFENEKRLDRWLKISAILDLPARIRRNTGNAPPPNPAAVPYNAESGHVQFFTRESLRSTLDRAGYRLCTFLNGAFLGAPLSERYLFRGESIAQWNARVADRLPHWAVSTWLFTAEKKR
jgi:SAM-dependent methyltransferase